MRQHSNLALVLALAGIISLASCMPQNGEVFGLIQSYRFDDTKAQEDLLNALKPGHMERTVNCLVNAPGASNCDPRTPQLKEVIQVLSRNDYKCNDCPLELKFFISYVKAAMTENAQLCNTLIARLNLKDPGCKTAR
ncbi:uncharacterized protein LOC135204118 [Macrobrachium nipponense]|uniref:uncharacterized protein LOC135204118 n=1 Tax=Macrobrachium nipponense TaxID=159736 RepID=UPI0030C8884A